MARIHLTLLSVLLYCITYIYAAGTTVNSIAGPVAQGATVYITYQFTTPPPGKVTLQVINLTTKDTKFLSEDVPITPPSFKWIVDVPVGTYYLAINDGSGQVFSGNFDVSAGTLPPSTGSAPAATPAPSPAPAPAPPAPAASATAPASAPAPAASSSSAASSTTSPAAAESPAKPSAANSAPSFSGYSLLISLAVVAAVMFHMA